jgi:hypothetical protein
MKLLERIKNYFSKDYCHICKKAFKNYRGYKYHVFAKHSNGISDEGVVIHENA